MACQAPTEDNEQSVVGQRHGQSVLCQRHGQSGVALFMVMGAIAVLTLLVTELTYVSQVSQTIAYDSLDQVKAHYLAKSAFKISLLRLKAYQTLKSSAASIPGMNLVPRSMLDQIWSFPLIFPIPSQLPGLSMGDRDAIEKFQKDTGLDGRFSATIESESSKFALNSLLAPYAAPTPSPTPGATPTVGPTSGPVAFDAAAARKSLFDLLESLLAPKIKDDPAFAEEYRDLRLDDLVDTIAAWEDRTYERRGTDRGDPVPMKRAPFYSVEELHLIRPIDDTLYDLLAPQFTVHATSGLNINTMREPTLRALVPAMTDEEVKEFFKFRDSQTEDNSFKKSDDFYSYLQKNVLAYSRDTSAINTLKQSFTTRGIQLVTDESVFRVRVQSQVNQTIRTLEAVVTYEKATPGPPKSGLRIQYMRIL